MLPTINGRRRGADLVEDHDEDRRFTEFSKQGCPMPECLLFLYNSVKFLEEETTIR
jgi:hypothetical protein